MGNLKKIAALILAMILVLPLLPASFTASSEGMQTGLGDDAVLPAYSAQTDYMFYDSWDNSFDVRGVIEGSAVNTTFSNSGYKWTMWDCAGSHKFVLFGDELGQASEAVNGVQYKVTPSFTDDGKTIRLTFTFCNVTSSALSIGLGAWADPMIGGSDNCNVYLKDNGQTIQVTDIHAGPRSVIGLSCSFYADEDTPFSGSWIGFYANRDKYNAHFDFETLNSEYPDAYHDLGNGNYYFNGDDSVVCAHWDIELAPYETCTRTCCFRVDPILIADSLSHNPD